MARVNILLDASMMDTFLSCPRKYFYRYQENKVTVQKAKPLDRGGVMHMGFEHYYQTLQDHNYNWERSVDNGLVGIRHALLDSDLSSEDGDRCLEVFEESVTLFKDDDLSWEIVAVEKAFTYTLYEDEVFRIVMMGKIDLLRSNERYTNCPMDHKSYERAFPLTRLTNQFQNYAYAMKSDYLFVNRVGFQKSLKPVDKHKRVPLSYDPMILEQWRNNTIAWCMQYWDCFDTKTFPMNFTSCDKYNRICEYHEICDTGDEEGKVYKLNVNFKTDTPWDVGKILSQKG